MAGMDNLITLRAFLVREGVEPAQDLYWQIATLAQPSHLIYFIKIEILVHVVLLVQLVNSLIQVYLIYAKPANLNVCIVQLLPTIVHIHMPVQSDFIIIIPLTHVWRHVPTDIGPTASTLGNASSVMMDVVYAMAEVTILVQCARLQQIALRSSKLDILTVASRTVQMETLK